MVDEAGDLADQVLSLSRDLEDRIQLAEALNLQGVLAFSKGSPETALARFEEVASIFEELGNVEKLLPILNNIGIIHEARGDYEDAESCFSEALSSSIDIGNRDGELAFRSNLGGVRVALGRAAEGEADLRLVIEQAAHGLHVLPETYRFLGGALLSQDRLDEALEAATTSLGLALDSEVPDLIGPAWRVLGQVASRMGGSIEVTSDGLKGPYTAEECFQNSLELADQIDSDDDRARTLTAWAIHDRSEGRTTESADRWDQARRLFQQLGAVSEIGRTERILVDAESD